MAKQGWDQWGGVGEFIAERRRAGELTLRQLAERAGVSNPYLSQIERGLRRPSAEVLQQLARALQVSAETLYVRAGILDPDDHDSSTVEQAVLADPRLGDRQRRLLLELYDSFVSHPPPDVPPTAPSSAAPTQAPSHRGGTDDRSEP